MGWGGRAHPDVQLGGRRGTRGQPATSFPIGVLGGASKRYSSRMEAQSLVAPRRADSPPRPIWIRDRNTSVRGRGIRPITFPQGASSENNGSTDPAMYA